MKYTTKTACLTVFMTSLLFAKEVTSDHVYLNQFGVHIEGDHHEADRVARETGMRNLGQIGSLVHHYLFEASNREKRSSSISHDHHSLLTAHEKVKWFEQQKTLIRKKRDFKPRDVAPQMTIVDPLWKDEWYMQGGGNNGYDMNVLDAWRNGYTGKDIVVTILDDGLERVHPDLKRNYDPFASYDVNNHDDDPMPRYDMTNENRHGTRCAGEVSAEGNNTKCIIGIAPNSRIGGVRMLDGEVSDAVEAASLSFNRSHIDIYSASWGPDDDGKVVEGPGRLARKAFTDGIEMGRHGKGSIFVWASGNGGSAFDSCNCDGYANSIFTLSISSTSENGLKPWYLEECSSTLATTYSSGSSMEKKIATTDLQGRCTVSHTGTSASAPLAAGIVALTLSANSDLTWRDVQYITMMTSRPEPMQDGNWITNGVGRKVSLRYGYGLMDASAMVSLALVWNSVPPKHECLVVSDVHNQELHAQQKFTSHLETTGCKGFATEVNYLEHVQAKVSLTYQRRGDMVLYLVSPSGTRSKLLPYRRRDVLQGGFDNWPFLSVHFWGENPAGTWTLEVEDGDPRRQRVGGGNFLAWSLVLHGTKTQPVKLKNGTSTPKPSTTTTPKPTTTYKKETPLVSNKPNSTTTYKTEAPVISNKPNSTTTYKTEAPVVSNKPTSTTISKTETPVVSNKPNSTTTYKTEAPVVSNKPNSTTMSKTEAPVVSNKPNSTTMSKTEAPVVSNKPNSTTTYKTEAPVVSNKPNSTTMSKTEAPVVSNKPNSTTTYKTEAPVVSNKPNSTTMSKTETPLISNKPNSTTTYKTETPVVSKKPNSTTMSKTEAPVISNKPNSTTTYKTEAPVVNNKLNSTTTYKTEAPVVSSKLNSTTTYKTEAPVRCHPECQGGCHGTKAYDCVHCKNFQMGKTSECVPRCPDGHFSLDSICQLCDLSCATCKGPTLDQCLTCKPNLYLDETHHVCTAECASGYFIQDNRACRRCHPSCKECVTASTECTACQHGRHLQGTTCLSSTTKHNNEVFKNVTVLIIAGCAVIAALLLVLLGLLYARNNFYLCWKEPLRYGRVPADDSEDTVHLVYNDDYEDEPAK